MPLFIMILFITMMSFNAMAKDNNPPETKESPVTDKIHGFEITDEYRWLEDKDDPEVKKWSHAQHDYTVDYIKSLPEIKGLWDEIKAYLDRDVIGSPFFRGYREFFTARKKGDKQSKLYTRIDGKEILIFDPEKYDPTGKSAMTGMVFTEDGNRAAIGLQFQGNEINDYRIIDTKTGEVLRDVLENVYSFGWTKDEKHAYLSFRDEEIIKNQLPIPTYLHKIGDDHKKDKLLIKPDDAKNYASVWDTEEGGLTFFSTGDFYSNKLMVRPAGSSEEPVEIYSSDKYTAFPQVKNGKIYFMTNNDAPNYKIMITDKDKPGFNNWKEFYPEKETVLEGFEITTDYVIIQDKKDVMSRLTAYDFDGKKIRELKLPETADVAGMSYHKETNTVFVSLATFTASSKVYKLDGKTLEWEFFYQDKPPIDTKDIEAKLVFYESYDGTKVPMFIVHKKGINLDGTNPTLLYGYGGFNINMASPRFLGTTASFVNRGGIYAVAGLRGGSEYGESWHRDGMLTKKQNTFDDFHSAGEYLINNNYTNPDKLAIKGGSNGGLLVGAAVTQRPDLYNTAICAVPLLDMLRYHKFLIARFWIPEYGDPDKKEDFLNLLEYSPYHNIRPGFNYPTIMVKAGENDSRVDPLHAKKFAAALQNNPGQKNPVYLYVDFESGHGSGQSIDQMVDNIELEWRWLMHNLDMK